MAEKDCKISKAELPKYYFRKNGHAEDAEKIRARSRLYQRLNPAKVKAYKKKNAERYREYMRNFFAKRREYAEANGLCGNCLREKENDQTIFCTACRERAKKNARAQRRRRQNARKNISKKS
jgi:hypothetical protein